MTKAEVERKSVDNLLDELHNDIIYCDSKVAEDTAALLGLMHDAVYFDKEDYDDVSVEINSLVRDFKNNCECSKR